MFLGNPGFVYKGNQANVVGPASSTNNAVPRFSGTDGRTLKNSGVIIDDSNNIAGVAALTSSGVLTLTSTLSPSSPSANAAVKCSGGATFNGDIWLNGSRDVGASGAIGVRSSTAGGQIQLTTTGGATVNPGVVIDCSSNITIDAVDRSMLSVRGTMASTLPGVGVMRSIYVNTTINTSGTSNHVISLIDISPSSVTMTASDTLYGIRSRINTGAGTRYNAYFDGTADNYFAGSIVSANTTNATTSATGAFRTSGGIGVAQDIVTSATSSIYFGDSATDGTWRMVRSGNNLVIQRREAGAYVTKSTISA